jgi:magnesium-transporting ATPase (P-type)
MNVHSLTNNGTAAHVAELSTGEVLSAFVTSPEGISETEAVARLKQFGMNRPPRPEASHWYVELSRQFTHLFAVLLWTAAFLAWWVNMPEIATAIVIVVIINGIFSYWQQYKAERAVEALESLLPRSVNVRRLGVETTVDSETVTLGDILILREGNSIPADARLIHAESLRMDASALTGESRPVARTADSCRALDKSVSELSNIVFAGTFVVSGREHTEFGRLAALTHRQQRLDSPLQREMRRVTRIVTILAVSMGVICFIAGWGTGRLSLLGGFIFALGIIVANVPEGLLPTLSLTLAISVRKMARRNAIVKRLERVEALGAVSVIVTDKTGTLTHNQMTVRELWCAGYFYQVTGAGYEPDGQVLKDGFPAADDSARLLVQTAALCCDARLVPPREPGSGWMAIGDPTESALLVAARKLQLTDEILSQNPRLAELPFDSLRKRMTTIHRFQDQFVACMKGAVNEILPRCTDFGSDRAEICASEVERVARAFADRGLRVLAVARREITNHHLPPEEVETNMTFLGLIAMEDPPRAEVAAAIADCHRAGIHVIMATGDDGHTAAAISREIALYRGDVRIVTGVELDRLSDKSLGLLLGHRNILFSRVSPAHKLRLVETLQQRGEVVAVTGDGVNDAPALKRADVGVAMGKRGTDVARAAADVILLDDNFATIVAAIEEGRTVYANVRKLVTYIFASNVPEIVPFIAFVLFRIPLPLTVMQILAVDLGTDLFPALALAVEPSEPDIMRRPPRARHSPLLDKGILLRAYLWLGVLEAALCLIGFFFVYYDAGWRPGAPMESSGHLYVMATTMSLAGIIACQIGNAFACRSDHRSIFSLRLLSNRPLLFAMLVEILLLLALIYLPWPARIFQLAPLGTAHWALLATFGPILLGAEELRKWWVARPRPFRMASDRAGKA